MVVEATKFFCDLEFGSCCVELWAVLFLVKACLNISAKLVAAVLFYIQSTLLTAPTYSNAFLVVVGQTPWVQAYLGIVD